MLANTKNTPIRINPTDVKNLFWVVFLGIEIMLKFFGYFIPNLLPITQPKIYKGT